MSFRLSVRHKTALYRNTGRVGLLLSTYRTLCFKEIVYLQNKGTFLWNFVRNCEIKNLAKASRSRCQQDSSTVDPVDDTYTTVDESWLFTTRRSTVTLQLHHCDLLWICCATCFCSCAAVDASLTDSALRAMSAVAKLLVSVLKTTLLIFIRPKKLLRLL